MTSVAVSPITAAPQMQPAKTLQEAAARLGEQTYSAAVIDQFVLETDPEESDQVLEHLGTAYPIDINFALTGMDRLLREVYGIASPKARRIGCQACHCRTNA